TEELAEELEVRGLATAGTGAGEFEQGLQQLDVLHLARVERVPVHLRKREEELPVRRLLVVKRRQRHHVDRLVAFLALALDGAHLDAEAAARAVRGGDLQRESIRPELAPAGGRRLEGG